MNEKDLFAGLRPPRPGDAVRERVLAAAARVAAPAPGWIDRLWESREARRAWRIAAVLLLGAHLVLALRDSGLVTGVEKQESSQGAEPGLEFSNERVMTLRVTPRGPSLADFKRWYGEMREQQGL